MNEEGDTLDIARYPKEYLRITSSCILTPGAFFRDMKNEEKQYLKPFAYALISMAVYLVGSAPLSLFIRNYSLAQLIIFMQYLFITFIIFSSVLILIMSLSGKVIGREVNFNHAFKVFCYSTSILNFSWIIYVIIFISQIQNNYNYYNIFIPLFILFILIPLWVDGFFYMFYLNIAGISIVSNIPVPRLLRNIIISFILLFTLILSCSYLIDLSQRPPQPYPPYATPSPTVPVPTNSPQNPTTGNYNLYAYTSKAPLIDGTMSDNETWGEAGEVLIDAKGIQYLIDTKHDRENLYILMRWHGVPPLKNRISIYFEQDEFGPDSNINTGRIDRYYQGNKSYPSVLIDGHYRSGYIEDKQQDGSLKVGHNDKKGEWVMEWKIPLSSGDMDDIFVNDFPVIIGFSIMNDLEGGILPPHADRNDTGTWGNIKILDERKQ